MNFEENIESYINNDLSEGDRHTFEKAMATDAALRQSVDEQRLIINLLRQNRAATIANNTVEKKRLKGVIDGYIAELPDVEPQKQENTEGGKIIPLLPSKKNNRTWWAAAASVAVVVATAIWFFTPKSELQPPVIVQTPPIVTPLMDTFKKNDVPIVGKPLVIQPKEAPQYSAEKKEKGTITEQNKEQKASETPKTPIDVPSNNDAVLAVLENIADKEYEQIVEPTKGTTSNVSREDQILLTALEAIAANKPTVALEALRGRNDEKARYYQALATLLMDKNKGKQALEVIASDANLEVYFRNKIKALLKKLE